VNPWFQGCRRRTPGVQETHPRGAPQVPDPHNYPLSDPHKDPPNEAPIARAGAREVLGQGVLFGEAPPQSTTAPKREQPRKRGAPKSRPRWQDYAHAFVTGCADAGVTITPLSAGEGATLGRVAAAHAKGPDGQPLKGPAVDAWLRGTAAPFTRAGGSLTAWAFKAYCDRTFGGARASPSPRGGSLDRRQPHAIAKGQDAGWNEFEVGDE
jgi:hypothetical protein